MKESYSEDPASHTGPELYAGDGNIAGVATTGVHAGEVLSPEKRNSRVPTLSGLWEGHIVPSALASRGRTRRGRRPYMHAWKLQAREPGDPIGFQRRSPKRDPITGTVRKHRRWYR